MDKTIYKDKKYWHFDGHKTIQMVKDYISLNDNIITHSFYPFIHYELKFNKFNKNKNNGKKKPKIRDIYYSAHVDRYIYQRFANEYSILYNEYCRVHGFDKCSIAYRNNKKGKCNIHFAKEVFDFIKQNENCFIMVGDFTNFFDNLDHLYLKEKLCKLSKQNQLTDIQYKIFKNITKFSYVDIKDIAQFFNMPQNKINKLNHGLGTAEFQNLKKMYLKQNKDENGKWKTYGIPQGSPISAIYASIYMIDFDRQLNSLVKRYKGLYRRYSDDFIVVIPNTNLEQFKNYAISILKIVNNVPKLILENNKTAFYYYTNSELITKNNILDNQINESKILNFLGFSFDGKNIKFRDKTITKYYYKLYRIIDGQIKLELKRIYNNPKGRKQVKNRRKSIIKKKSKFGAKIINGKGSNFISYVNKSLQLFRNEPYIRQVKERSLDKISKRFNIENRLVNGEKFD